jgi:hypothetical protein
MKNLRQIAVMAALLFAHGLECSAETPAEGMARVVAEIHALQAAHSNGTYSGATVQDGSGEAMAADGAPDDIWIGSCSTCATSLLLRPPALQGSNAVLTAVTSILGRKARPAMGEGEASDGLNPLLPLLT